ncbi:MAG: PQQ-dependent sugar dehydrogenase [Terracidiphilus sp.]
MTKFPVVALSALAALLLPASLPAQQVISGQAAFAGWAQQKPGVRRKITVTDLPAPAPEQAVNNTPRVIVRPADAWPIAPAGFKVTLYAGGNSTPMQRADNTRHMRLSNGTFTMPRLMVTAPNGDIFLADSGAGTIFVLRGVTADGRAAHIEKFATGLDHPFGIAFYPTKNPRYVYVGNATTIQRFPYKTGDLHAAGPAQTIVPNIPGYAQLMGGGHWTRDVVFTKDGRHMLVSVGSASNIDNPDTHPREFHRADILEYTPEGKFIEVYAHGLRNCVGEAINPVTGSLWCSTNERDDLGNHLPPDYVTSVKEGGFYGWPWYYIGGHRDPRLPEPCADGAGPNPQLAAPLTPEQGAHCKHVNLASKVIVPDVLVQPHMASLEMTFYPDSGNFPADYHGWVFAAEHGSWNRQNRAGYEVIAIPMHDGRADGSYEDFLTGFVTKDGKVWGRPVGVAVGSDGALYVSDDGSRSVWRVAYTGK